MPHIDELLVQSAPAWERARRRGAIGPRVLVATTMGGFNHGATTEKALAIALTLRGASVDFLLCDGLPGCQITKIGKETPERMIATDLRLRCPQCLSDGEKQFDPTGLEVLKLSHFLRPEDRAEAVALGEKANIPKLKEMTLDGWRIGEHALAGALRFYARGELGPEPMGEGVARSFVRSAVLTARAIDRLFATNVYDVAVFNHGIYVPQGVIGEVARSRGVRVVNWNAAYRRHCFVFSHEDSYHHTMISEPTATWENLELTPERRERVITYLRSRRDAKDDWIWFNKAADASRSEIGKELGLDNRPMVVALTSVVWDACLHYDSNAFESLKDWMLQTVAYFAKRQDLQLVIRVHPAEVSGLVKSRDKMADIIAAAYPTLPPNVKVVPPENPLSTYSLLDNANACLVYSTKTGIEASATGLPVVVAGEAWIRNKGFTRDAVSPSSYRSILDTLPFADRLDQAQQDRAMRYAYHFFFRRMIDMPFLVDREKNQFSIEVDQLDDLLPGNFSGLDCICDGVLHGTPFVHDGDVEETAAASDASPKRKSA